MFEREIQLSSFASLAAAAGGSPPRTPGSGRGGKAIARRLAENGATQKMIKSVGGWSNDREVAIYTAGADQAELARTALTALAEWEAQTLGRSPPS